MLSPDAEAEEADGAQRQHDGTLGPNRFAREGRDEVGDDAEARKDRYVDLRLRKEPEQALPEGGSDAADERYCFSPISTATVRRK